MHEPHFIFLLTYMVAVATQVALAFNIDMTNPNVYTGEEEDFFGYKVLQFKSDSDKGIIVTAPLQRNGSGAICKPYHNNTVQCFNPEATSDSLTNKTIPIKHFGLSVAEDPIRSQLTVCSPSVTHECDDNIYLNSVCFKLSDSLQQISSFKPAFQDCTKKTVDLVFLFDGSASMTEEEFNKNKDFIVDIMNNLKNTSIKFAAVQFSSPYRKVFDFNDYEAGSALNNLMRETQLKSLTNTHKALKYVLEEMLENPAAGASPDAIKVLVLITDGDPSDTDKLGIIKRYNAKKIIRLVIGVKDAKLDKFREIASEPKNAFKIKNYDGLDTVLKNFQKQIFSIEGSKAALAGNLTNEMSQSGFDAVFYKETLILGSVGTNSWRGSLQEINTENETQIADPDMQMDSYLGYSTAVGERNKAPLYFTGAPRFEHTGQVVLFRHDGKNWTTAQRIKGDQIGSYFGAELCSVDVNADGDTDFLLVGAPQFYQPLEKSEGQIYVYTLTHEMQLKRGLTIPAVTMGRFGSTITSLADLNGDGLRDVAVGAPLEDDNRGAVYIYLGDRERGIRSTVSQRIIGQEIKPGLRFFGQAIDGDIDLGDDELPDIVVGSQGTAVVLRSRPVFNVTADLSFKPKEISTDKLDCLGKQDGLFRVVTLRACFEMVKTTKSKAGTGLNITYTLNVDPMRQTHRAVFSHTNWKARNLSSTYEQKERKKCFNHSLYMPKCVKDTLSPISVKLNFSQVNSENAGAILNIDSKRQTAVEIPFEKRCRNNDTCNAELEVDFDFMTPTLLVAEDNYFNVSVTLTNYGDDSYNTSLTMHYPLGLSFARMNLTKSTRLTLHSCGDEEEVLDKTTCRISQPVYRSGSSATFKTSFHIMPEYEWNDTISMTITGNSDNTNSTRTNSLTKSIRVQFEIKTAVAVKEGSDTFLTLTPEDTEPKKIVTIYKIDNPGFKGFPVNVSLFFPTRLEHDFEIDKYQVVVQENKAQCTRITDMTSEFCSAEKHCKVINCDPFILEKESSIEFLLFGDVQFRSLTQHAKNIPFLTKYTGESAEVKFKSFIHVSYEKQRYALDPRRQQNNESSKKEKPDEDKDPTMKSSEVGVEFIIAPNQPLIIATGAGLGILLLIIITVIMIKCGCFKRKKVEDFQECEANTAIQASTPTELNPGPTKGTVSQSETDAKLGQVSEEEKLLDGGETKDDNNPSAETKEALY